MHKIPKTDTMNSQFVKLFADMEQVMMSLLLIKTVLLNKGGVKEVGDLNSHI